MIEIIKQDRLHLTALCRQIDEDVLGIKYLPETKALEKSLEYICQSLTLPTLYFARNNKEEIPILQNAIAFVSSLYSYWKNSCPQLDYQRIYFNSFGIKKDPAISRAVVEYSFKCAKINYTAMELKDWRAFNPLLL